MAIKFISSNVTAQTVNSSNHNLTNNPNDISQVDTTGIVMATTDYNCGPAALATVMQNYFGIGVTQDQLATLAGTDENGTTIYGLAQAAKQQGMIAKGLRLTVDKLKPSNIAYLTINGKGHYSTITNMTNTTVYLADTSLGNINMTISDFKAAYSGKVLVITNNTNDTQLTCGTKLTNEEMQKIIGKGYNIDWPRTGVRLAGGVLIGLGAATLDPLAVAAGIGMVCSAYVR